MRSLGIFLVLAITLDIMPLYAQNSGKSDGQNVGQKSCQDQIKEKLKKLPNAGKTILTSAGSYAAGYTIAGFAMTSPLVGGAAFVALYSTGLTLAFAAPAAGVGILAVRKHRKNILEVFEGAASGGNKKTEKLWKLAIKKNLNAFKGITYEQFLSEIHKSDISGKACETESVPERKDILNVVIDLKDLEDEEPIHGEKINTEKSAQSNSSRDNKKIDKGASSENQKSSPANANQQ